MKKIIKQVLDELGDTQINLGSEASRETIASLLSAALKESGEYKEHSDSEIEEQEARKTWVCSICGENTADVEYDYLGSGTNHLGCEMKNWDEIKDYINKEDDADYYTGPEPRVDAILEETKKLSEEIVDSKDKDYIYESPDGGETVYKRKMGSDRRELVKDWEKLKNYG